jgi:hypothetical protein
MALKAGALCYAVLSSDVYNRVASQSAYRWTLPSDPQERGVGDRGSVGISASVVRRSCTVLGESLMLWKVE